MEELLDKYPTPAAPFIEKERKVGFDYHESEGLVKATESLEIPYEPFYSIGETVWAYDKCRFAIPLKAEILDFNNYNNGVRVKILQSNNPHYPIGCVMYLHIQQIGKILQKEIWSKKNGVRDEHMCN